MQGAGGERGENGPPGPTGEKVRTYRPGTTLCLNKTLSCLDFMDVIMGDILAAEVLVELYGAESPL